MIKKLFTGFVLCSFMTGISIGQNTSTLKEEDMAKTVEPITAMLDSMVNLKFLNKTDYIEATQSILFKDGNYEFKSFPDELYKNRLTALQSPIALDYNDQVRAWIGLYAKRPVLMSKVLGLANLYFPMFEQVLDQQGLPLEFKYLAIVESALNPTAVSVCGATGLWQFMYGTGIMYDLKATSNTDERRDPLKSTYAACKYFKDMYEIYHDWLLVIAAYNCGPGNVNRAIHLSGGSTNFWEISKYLPLETRGYVPSFIAVNYWMNYASDYNITPEQPAFSYFEVDTITATQPVTFNQLSQKLGLSVDVISYLNPVYKRGYVPTGEASSKLRLPFNKIGTFMANSESIYKASYLETASPYTLAQINKPTTVTAGTASNGTVIGSVRDGNYDLVTKDVTNYYTVRPGDCISGIAGRLNVSMNDLMNANHIYNSFIYPDQKLAYTTRITERIERPASKDSLEMAARKDSIEKANAIATADSIQKANAEKFVYHTVQPGDTLWTIAQKYQGSTVQRIRDINKLTSNQPLVPGSKIKVLIGG